MKNLRNVGMLFLFLGLLVSFTGCKKSPLTWDLVITNNTGAQLDIYERTGAGNYHHVGEVKANATTKERGYVFELDYTFEARNPITGAVVATFSHNQSTLKHEEISWVIN